MKLQTKNIIAGNNFQVSISNGLAWSEDRSTFYFIDSDTFKVEAFDYNEDAGDIGESFGQRVVGGDLGVEKQGIQW